MEAPGAIDHELVPRPAGKRFETDPPPLPEPSVGVVEVLELDLVVIEVAALVVELEAALVVVGAAAGEVLEEDVTTAVELEEVMAGTEVAVGVFVTVMNLRHVERRTFRAGRRAG